MFSGGSYTSCGTDPKCICANQDFHGKVVCCLVGACSDVDQASAIRVTFAQQICSANGVEVPDQVSCSTASGASATATATATGHRGRLPPCLAGWQPLAWRCDNVLGATMVWR